MLIKWKTFLRELTIKKMSLKKMKILVEGFFITHSGQLGRQEYPSAASV
jgi:hypothetical protein